MDSNNPEQRKYMLLAERLREQVTSELLAPGSKIPTVQNLARTHRISQQTATKAVHVLAREGLLYLVPGQGFYVTAHAEQGDHAGQDTRTAAAGTPADPRPYMAIAAGIRAGISTGVLAPGSSIPGRDALCQAHQVSKATATKALQVLQREGLVYSLPGLGFFVTPRVAAEERADDDRRA